MHFDAVQQVLRDAEHFSSRMYAQVIGIVMGPTVLQLDPSEHTRVRALIQFAFSRTELARWERELVAPAVARPIDRFAARDVHVSGDSFRAPRELPVVFDTR